jgi:PAS domain S-box-containing protein
MPHSGSTPRPTMWAAPALVALAVVVILLVTSAVVAFGAMAASRAVAEGESQWTRYQKDLVLLYHAWGTRGDPADRARLEENLHYHRQVDEVFALVTSEEPDQRAIARAAAQVEGFENAAPHFARAFSWFRISAVASQVIEAWGEALVGIQGLMDLLPELDRAVAEGDRAAADALLARATELDREIQLHREQYLVGSEEWIGLAFRVPALAIPLLGLILLLGGAAGIRTVLRRMDRAQRELVESRERFRQVMEEIHEVFWLSTPDKREMLYVSPAYESIWGEPVEHASDSFLGWADRVLPEDRPRVLEAVERQRLEELEYEYRIHDAQGRLRWIRERSFPVRDEGGRVVRIAGISEDVTDRKALEIELLQAQRLRSVARLAAGVGHEFNNVLTAIRSHASFLAEDLGEDPGAMADLEGIRSSTLRAEALTRKLLAFGRQQVVIPVPLALPPFLDELDRLLHSLLPPGIHLSLHVEPDLPQVLADESHLREAVVSLVGNSREALEGTGGRIAVVARRLAPIDLVSLPEMDRSVISSAGGPLEGDRYLVLEIRDDGPGIPESRQERIFEPFHWAREGTPSQGLGLPSVLGIMDQMGGGIRLDSVLGEGTVVRLYLPLVQDAEAPVPGSGGPVAPGTPVPDAGGPVGPTLSGASPSGTPSPPAAPPQESPAAREG